MTPEEEFEFHANRRTCISCSDISAILGVSPWQKPIDVWRYKKGIADPIPDNDAMYMGRVLEPYIAEVYTEMTGLKLETHGFKKHPIYNIGGHPDRLVIGQRKGVEIKTTLRNFNAAWGEEGTDQVPIYYLTQCIGYMGIFDFDLWDLIAMIGGKKPLIYNIERNLGFETEIFQKVQYWWEKYIVGDVPPEIDDSESYGDYLAHKFKKSTLPMIDGDLVVNQRMLNLAKIKKNIEELKEDQTLIENQLKAQIGNSEGFKTSIGTVTWRNNKPSAKVDWEGIAYELKVTPEIMAKHTYEKPGARVFRMNIFNK